MLARELLGSLAELDAALVDGSDALPRERGLLGGVVVQAGEGDLRELGERERGADLVEGGLVSHDDPCLPAAGRADLAHGDIDHRVAKPRTDRFASRRRDGAREEYDALRAQPALDLEPEGQPGLQLVDQAQQPLALALTARELVGETFGLIVEIEERLVWLERDELVPAEVDLLRDECGERCLDGVIPAQELPDELGVCQVLLQMSQPLVVARDAQRLEALGHLGVLGHRDAHVDDTHVLQRVDRGVQHRRMPDDGHLLHPRD